MEPNYIPQTNTTPMMDIKSPEKIHHSRKFVMITSIILIVLALVLIGLYIKQRNDYRNYLMNTPEGQMELLRNSSQPVTTTNEQQYQALIELEKSSTQTTVSREQRLKELEIFGQQ